MTGTWKIAESAFSLKTARAYEGLFTLGSGSLHVRGSLEEHLAGFPQNIEYTRKPADVTIEEFPDTPLCFGTFAPGFFAPHPLLGNEMVNLPWFLDLCPFLGEEKLDMAASTVRDYGRTLHMRSALLERSLSWTTRDGAVLAVRFERFVSLTRPSLCVQRLILESDRDTVVTIRAGIDGDVRTNGYDHFAFLEVVPEGPAGVRCRAVIRGGVDSAEDGGAQANCGGQAGGGAQAGGGGPSAGAEPAAGDSFEFGGDRVFIASRLSPPGASWRFIAEPRRGRLAAELPLTAGRPLAVEKRTAVGVSRDPGFRDPVAVLDEAAGLGYEDLYREHAAAWAALWESADVIAEGGGEEVQRRLRCSVFHLLRARPPVHGRAAVDPKGFSGAAYFGRFFWDTEMFLLPFWIYTDPERARNLVDFRLKTLDGARANAVTTGYRGARYPWESDAAGRECCPNRRYAEREIHVTADVVHGLAHFAAAVDPAYLTGPAADAVVETARFWMSRIERRPGEDRPSLLGVMGPDEYTPLSDNNAYTHRLAAFNLALAARIGPRGGASAEERAAFAAAAAGLALPRIRGGAPPAGRDRGGNLRGGRGRAGPGRGGGLPEGKDRVGTDLGEEGFEGKDRAPGDCGESVLVLQCEGFEGLGEIDFDSLWKDRTRPFAAQVPEDLIHRSKCLKQADVLMLMALFPEEFTGEEVRAAWRYYLPFTTHDSSLSPAVHAVVASRLGLLDEAWEFWLRSLALDGDPGRGGAAEGVHIAACGGNWQAAVFGFAGMRTALQSDVLFLDPRLPPALTRLAFSVVWKGTPVRVEVTGEGCTVENRGTRPLAVRVAGVEGTIPAGEARPFALGRKGRKG